MDFDALLADYQAQLDWLLTLVRDPQGRRFLAPRPIAERQVLYQARLEKMRGFLNFIGNPQRQFRSVHVAGTSGKGSVTSMIAALLQACGRRTADHTSPYLQIPNEKLRLNGQMIAPSELGGLIEDFRPKYAAWLAQGGDLLYGEAWVALTFAWLAQQQPDWAVIETGMGGRLDATNVLPSSLAVITNVGYDHMQVLGETLAEIAWHKAGIIKEGGVVVSAESNPDTLAILQQEARSQHAAFHPLHATHHPDGAFTLHAPHHTYHLALPLAGTYQQANAALAIAAVDWLAGAHDFPLTLDHIHTALDHFNLPGRFELVAERPQVILDGAHNQPKMQALAASLAACYPDRRLTVIIGLLYAKDAHSMLAALQPVARRFIVTQPHVFGKPALPPVALAQAARSAAPDCPVTMAPDVQAALDEALATADPDDIILVTGSIYLVGEARERWHPRLTLLRQLETAAHPTPTTQPPNYPTPPESPP